MSQKVNSGKVVVSDTEVTVSEVSSNGVVLAPTVSVEKIHSGGVVVADTIKNLSEVFSGGVVVTTDSVDDVEFYAGGKHAKSVSELVLEYVGDVDRDLLNTAYKNPQKHNTPSGRATPETTIAKIGEARNKAGDVLSSIDLEV